MSKVDIISVIESPMHPNFSELYAELGFTEIKVNSIRKAINLIKKQAPKYLIAEFFYAYSTNYSGVHKSNLDVLLVSLLKYSPATQIIVLSDKEDARYIDVLNTLGFPLYATLVHPTSASDMRVLLQK